MATVAIGRPTPAVAWHGLSAAGALGLVLAAGYGAASGHAPTLLAALLGLAALAGCVLRPEVAIVAWVAAMLASGRAISHLGLGPAYVTEIVLAATGLAVLVRFFGARGLEPGVALTLVLFGLLAVPAAVGLALETDLEGDTWPRALALVYYAFFAVVAASLRPSARYWRALGVAVVGASIVALIVVASGHGSFGVDETTTTGARRIAHGSFSLPFGIAPLVIVAAVRHGLASRRCLLLVPPFLAGLVLVNHRSAWIAFVLAAATLLVRRPGVLLALTATVAAAVTVWSLLPAARASSPIAEEIERARSITDTDDPNAHYRLSFWEGLLERGASSPVYGSGFDPYPFDLVPTQSRPDAGADPHNSFVALVYRVGPLACALLLGLLGGLLVRGFRLTGAREDPLRSAVVGALTGIVVYVGVFAAFNVALEVPYHASLFWIAVGLLAGAVARTRASQAEPIRA